MNRSELQSSSPRAARTRSPAPPQSPTPRTLALCPAPRRAALPRVREGATAEPALTRAELPARAGVRCAAQTGVGDGRARAAPMPAPRRDRVRAERQAAPAAGGSAPRASRGPPAPPPPSGKQRAPGPAPAPRTPPAPTPLAARLGPQQGREDPRRWAVVARRRSAVPASRRLSAPFSWRAHPAQDPRAFTLKHRAAPGLGRSLTSEPRSPLPAHKDQVPSKVDRTGDAATPGAWGSPPPI